MQKKIIMAHIVMYALCAVATNVSYAKTEIKPITMVCDSDLKSMRGVRLNKKFKTIAAGQEGETLTLTTKEIKVKGVTKELDDYESDQLIDARCTKNTGIKERMSPEEDNLKPSITCPKGSGIEVWFTLSDLPEGYQFSDFTYHAELKIESDDEGSAKVQEIVNSQQQIKLDIQDSMHFLVSNSLVSDKHEQVKQDSEQSKKLTLIETEKEMAALQEKIKAGEQAKIYYENRIKEVENEKTKLKNFSAKIDEVQHSKEAQDLAIISEKIRKLQEQDASLATEEDKLKDKIAKLQTEYTLAAKRK